ncbi:MAG TPA: anthranilate synthase component I family protein [Candidatus Saccharimonadales bacterium]|nr:anthranilate synthase component I family protein [Candidatus Saccharimonadales bacterium]
MKTKPVITKHRLSGLLTRLTSDVRGVCLLTGSAGGWKKRLAWDPCDSHSIDTGSSLDNSVFEFIGKHQALNNLIVGFVSYNLGYGLHGLKPTKPDVLNLPNIALYAYDNYLEEVGGKVYAKYTHDEFLKSVENLKTYADAKITNSPAPDFRPQWTRRQYYEAFSKIKRHIFDGDVYQINLTQKLTAGYNGDSRTLFSNLAENNTAKMMAYFEGEDFELISMSPERFIRTRGQVIETFPIKGTRRRGKDKAADRHNKKALLADEKEKAELNMITDLLRNDLGKVCRAGSVNVIKKRAVEELTAVMHTFSLIRGELGRNVSPAEALFSMFPGGSVTGCPKRKAMELIDELESSNRSAYCGSIAVIDGSGDLDSSILIRTIIQKRNQLHLSVGGGIVHDSTARSEYAESLDKAKSLIRS